MQSFSTSPSFVHLPRHGFKQEMPRQDTSFDIAKFGLYNSVLLKGKKSGKAGTLCGKRAPRGKMEELPKKQSDIYPFPVNPDGYTLLYAGIPIQAITDAVGTMIRGIRNVLGNRKTVSSESAEQIVIFSSDSFSAASEKKRMMDREKPENIYLLTESISKDGNRTFIVTELKLDESLFSPLKGAIKDKDVLERFSKYTKEWLEFIIAHRNRLQFYRNELESLVRIRQTFLDLDDAFQKEAIGLMEEIEPSEYIDNPTIKNPLKSAPPSNICTCLRNFVMMRRALQERGVAATYEEVRFLVLDRAFNDIVVASREFFGTMEIGTTTEAALFRSRLVRKWFGFDIPSHNLVYMPSAIGFMEFGDGAQVRLEFGKYEGAAGLQFTLHSTNKEGMKVPLATIGFHETDNEITINRYQGHKNRSSEMREFRRYSGGVAPLPWLANAVGRLLLGKALRSGKALKWISGEYVRMAYPHSGINSEDINSYFMTLQDARDYLSGEGKYMRVPADDFESTMGTIKKYNDTATALGFVRTMDDKDPSPWFVFDTSKPDIFGAGIAKGKGINPKKFERSIKDFDEALGTVSIPVMAQGKDFNPYWIFNNAPADLWSSENNPFVRDYAPYRTENSADPRRSEFFETQEVPSPASTGDTKLGDGKEAES